MAKTFILRNLDEAMWEKFKARAAQEGRPLRWVALRVLTLYAEKGLDALEKAEPEYDDGTAPKHRVLP